VDSVRDNILPIQTSSPVARDPFPSPSPFFEMSRHPMRFWPRFFNPVPRYPYPFPLPVLPMTFYPYCLGKGPGRSHLNAPGRWLRMDAYLLILLDKNNAKRFKKICYTYIKCFGFTHEGSG
jgi:hypothetical protein